MKAVACFVILAPLLLAQHSPTTTDSSLNEARKLLDAFRGTWAITETYDPSDSMPQGGTGKGEEIWRGGPSDRSIIEEYHSTDQNGRTLDGFGLGWWEPESKGFRLNWCSNTSQNGCTTSSEPARWEGTTWVVRHSERSKEGNFDLKEVFSEITPTSFVQVLYQGRQADCARSIYSDPQTSVRALHTSGLATSNVIFMLVD